MTEKIARCIGKDKEEIVVINYGLHQLMIIMINLITMLICSIFWEQSIFCVLMFFGIFLLRPYAGGYHAKTEFGCYLLSVSVMNLAMGCRYITNNFGEILLFLYVIAICIIWKYSPVINEQHLLEDIEKVTYSNRAKRYLFFFTIVVVLSVFLKKYIIADAIIYSVLITAFGMIFGKIKYVRVER